MRCCSLIVTAFSLLAFVPVTVVASIAKTTSKQLELSWMFDWTSTDISQRDRQFPITAQCETLHITWARNTATGPDGAFPYFLQIYTSFGQSLLVVQAQKDLQMNLTIPFDAGTGYMICMFDKNGNTGGCQDLFTVYTAPNNTATPGSAACPQLTLPTANLDVQMTKGFTGDSLSSHGFVPQCSDVMLTPKSGTPPFTLTVASPLRPPLNITSNTMDPIVWTVDKAWGQPFFLSMVDSKGVTWAAGPLHGGGPGPTDCFAASTIKNARKQYTAGVVGSLFGGLVLGALLFFGSEILYRRNTRHKHLDPPPQWSQPAAWEKFPPAAPASLSATTGSSAIPVPVPIISSPPSARVRGNSMGPTTARTGSFSARQVDPFLDRNPSASAGTPRKAGLPRSPYPDESQPRSPESSVTLGRTISVSTTESSGERVSGQQVFLIHADGGSVIELPPTYATAGPSRSASVNSSKTE